MSEERPTRRHRRFNIALPLWVRFWEGLQKGADAKTTLESAVESISEDERTTTMTIGSGGCFFYASRKPAVGTPATMLVDIPMRVSGNGGRVLCQGKVVWVTEQEVEGKVGVACTIDSYKFKPPEKG